MTKALLAAAAVLAASCASQPHAVRPVVTAGGTVQVIDDIYHLARPTPDWIFREPAEIEDTGEHPGRYVFKSESRGEDLPGRQLWAKGFVESADLAKSVGARVRERLVAAAADDAGVLAEYLSSAADAVSEARYSGARIEMRYWWQIRTARADGDPGNVFEYFVQFTVDRQQMDAALARALEESDRNVPAGTQAEQAARDRVKNLLESGGL